VKCIALCAILYSAAKAEIEKDLTITAQARPLIEVSSNPMLAVPCNADAHSCCYIIIIYAVGSCTLYAVSFRRIQLTRSLISFPMLNDSIFFELFNFRKTTLKELKMNDFLHLTKSLRYLIKITPIYLPPPSRAGYLHCSIIFHSSFS